MAKLASGNALGFIGLGRMGSRIVERLLEKKFKVVAYNRSPEPLKEAEKKGAIAAASYADVAAKLPVPKTIWIMVPAGKPVDEVIDALLPSLREGDMLIDGGNSNYKDSMRRAKRLESSGIRYLDVGTSGGLEGARNGACLTIGGKAEDYEAARHVFEAVAVKNGYLHCGKSGAGHFVKTVHNSIEYGMLEAYGEGFEMLEKSPDFKLDLAAIAKVWGHGSVVRSWLLELCQAALEKDAKMKDYSGEIGGGETGTWAAEYARARGVEIPVIEASLAVRGRKGDADRFAGKIVGAIRREFGGHEMKKK
jgi:6-phosphogluconate dehydrogenase